MTAVFVYGTLVWPEVMEAVTGRRLAHRPAHVDGFARRRLRGREYPGLVADAGARTEGRLYEGVDAATLARLDRFEGSLYERRRVRAVALGGGPVEAFAYLVRAGHRGQLLPDAWDPVRFGREHLAAFLRDAAAFRAGDEAGAGARSFVR